MRVPGSLFFIGMLITFFGVFLVIVGAGIGNSFIFVFPFFIIGSSDSILFPFIFIFVMLAIVFLYWTFQMTHFDSETQNWTTCDKCGTIMPNDANYCANCGSPLKDGFEKEFWE